MEATAGLDFSLAFALSAMLLLISCLSIPATIYGVLTFLYGYESSRDKETRCRECGYILRGILEPRCSECGERI